MICCVPIEGRRLLMRIECDGEAWRDIHVSIFGKRPALPKTSDSLTEFAAQFEKIEFSMARQYVIRRISAMNLPSKTIARSLKQRLVSETVINRVIESFTAIGFLNDGEWTKGFVRRQTERKLGPRAIAQKLANKGFDREEIDEAMAGCKGAEGEESQIAAIIDLLKTRYRRKDLTDFKERQKVVAALARRGFEFPLIIKVMNLDNDL